MDDGIDSKSRTEPIFVGSGTALRRIVLSAIAALFVMICFLAASLVWRGGPQIIQAAKEGWRSTTHLSGSDARAPAEPTPKRASNADPEAPVTTIAIPSLTRSIGADEKGPRGLRPSSSPGTWVVSGDYPFESQIAREEGTVAFTLYVDDRGIPVRCQVTGSSGHQRLDQTACDLLLARARFIPALDADGKPIPAEFRNRFTWALAD
ncbi:energy transducer TonB [Sphingomonas sp. RS6]